MIDSFTTSNDLNKKKIIQALIIYINNQNRILIESVKLVNDGMNIHGYLIFLLQIENDRDEYKRIRHEDNGGRYNCDLGPGTGGRQPLDLSGGQFSGHGGHGTEAGPGGHQPVGQALNPVFLNPMSIPFPGPDKVRKLKSFPPSFFPPGQLPDDGPETVLSSVGGRGRQPPGS